MESPGRARAALSALATQSPRRRAPQPSTRTSWRGLYERIGAMKRLLFAVILVTGAAATVLGQSQAERYLAHGKAMWDQRLAKSAIASLEPAAKDNATAADAHETLGRIYTFKG